MIHVSRTVDRCSVRLAAAILVFTLSIAVACSAQAAGEQAVSQAVVDPFFSRHCIDCHGADSPEGGFDLTSLPRKLDDEAAFARWVRLYDRVDDLEMPPRESAQPSPEDRQKFLDALNASLTTAHAQQKGTVLRRLNRREYENTLNDLFGTNLDLADTLPEDGRSHEFDTVGQALGLSMVQLQRYLDGIDSVLDAAIVNSLAPPEQKVVRASYADTQGGEKFIGDVWLELDDGAVVFFKKFGYPSGMLREANVQQDGWYKVRVTGYAYQSDRPITFALGATTFARGVEQPTFGYFSLPPGQPTTIETTAFIKSRYMIEVTPVGITDRDNAIKKDGIANYRGPGLAVQHIEVEGPITGDFPGRGHRLLFDGLQRQEILPRNPKDRERTWYKPKFEIVSNDAAHDVVPILTRVATAAFRRPVRDREVEAYRELFQDTVEQGASFEEALRTSVAALFCAPDFLYFRESPGRLDDYALATRLAYFLTRSSPDAELLAAAREGRLTSDPAELRRQTDRLLADPHHERFVVDFTDAWLNLREIEFTNPDDKLFPEFDQPLQHAMLAETRSFFQALITENLGVTNIVRSDFAMLNERLAEQYGIAGVQGPEIRKVTLPANGVRGGFLSQGAVLKVSANGTNTSPVVRGVWVMERILGQTPPPPPVGVAGVEPDIRGATTLRELLDKHRSLVTCRSCHEMIDPPGFALESFNPIGGWRDRFRSVGDGDRVNLEINGRKVQYKLGPPVDASGRLPDGSTFSGFTEFRDHLAREQETLARTLATKFLTFGAGREMGFSDRREIDRIVQQTASHGYGVRDILYAVVASDLFQSK
ncbi:MAG: DUF1592 domain-containing protein [Planctomycetaceae bacterium]|nr:DUF1592 domain-containing protein [Planctomycetaceae bacterium]